MNEDQGKRFPVRVWLISFLGWTFDFYDLMLISFLLIPIGKDLGLSVSEEALDRKSVV